MALLDVLRGGVKTIHKITKAGKLQAPVSYVRVTARDEYGAPSSFSGAVSLTAIVDFANHLVRNKEGVEVMARATLTFLSVDDIVAATGGAGVDEDDQFTLADGSKGKVVGIGGFMDSVTYGPIPLTVHLG